MKKNKKKKQSIYRRIVIALVTVLILETVMFALSVWISGVEGTIISNAKENVRQQVYNKEISVNHAIIEQGSYLDMISEYLDNLIAANTNGSALDYVSTQENADYILSQIAEVVLDEITSRYLTSMFVVLANGEEETYKQGELLFNGIYLEDINTPNISNDNSDIFMKVGSSQMADSLGIERAKDCTEKFVYDSEDMDFYFNIYKACKNAKKIKEMDYAYWSGPYENDSGVRVMVYTRPLISANDEFYGTVGMEIPLTVMEKELVSWTTEEGLKSGFLIVEYDAVNGSIEESTINTVVGDDIKKYFNGVTKVNLTKSAAGKGFYFVNDMDFDGQKIYAVWSDIMIMDNQNAYRENQWAIIAVTGEDTLFGTVMDIRVRMIGTIFVSVLIGIILISVVARKASQPIVALGEELSNLDLEQGMELEHIGIREIDELANAINDTSKKRMEIEARLKEETERFVIALQSATDVIYEYDVQRDEFVVYSFSSTEGRRKLDKKVVEEFTRELSEFVHPDDLALVVLNIRTFRQKELECRLKYDMENNIYRWYRIIGSGVRNEANDIVKVIGNITDISEEKEAILMKQELTKIDFATELFNYGAGSEKCDLYIKSHSDRKDISLILLDLDDFSNINGYYGAHHCEMVINELGEIIRASIGDDDIAMRAGGDEIIILFTHSYGEETLQKSRELIKKINDLYIGDNEEFVLSASIAVVERKFGQNYEQLCREARIAMTYIKENCKGTAIIYDKQVHYKPRYENETMRINSVAHTVGGEGETLGTFAFNLFEHANDVNSSINMFIAQFGRIDGFKKVTIREADKDFATMTIKNQWCRDKEDYATHLVNHYKYKEMIFLTGMYDERNMIIADGVDGSLEKIRECLSDPLFKTDSHMLFGIFDNGEFYGDIILTGDEGRTWNRAGIIEIKSIVKVISAYVVKTKYDKASKAKSEFLSKMSHEIRTPMNAIIGMTQIALRERNDSEKVYECLGKIDSSTKYLLTLINDILDMSRIESGKVTIVEEPVKLDKFLDDLEVVVGANAKAKNINLIMDNNVTSNNIYMDAMRVNQVLINLIGNAIKFTDEGGIVRVNARQLEESEECVVIRFDVIDTGIGISEENRKKIFRSFEQAEETTAKNYGGTGLGLAISSNLVRMMGGNLSVESEIGRGSDFYFILELKKAQDEEFEEKTLEEDIYDEALFKGKKILLVEDNDLNIEIADDILSEAGFIVTQARDGKQAVDTFEKSEEGFFDLILMDIRMPVMDGLEATRNIRRLQRDDARTVPIIAMSANAFDEDMKKSVESGMNGHLSKPVDLPKLYSMLAKTLNEKK